MTLDLVQRAIVTDKIFDALHNIIDPEMGVDVVSLGLIYGVEVTADGTAHLSMTTTVKGCPAAQFLQDAVNAATAAVSGVNSTEVALTYEPKWRPDMALPEVQALF